MYPSLAALVCQYRGPTPRDPTGLSAVRLRTPAPMQPKCTPTPLMAGSNSVPRASFGGLWPSAAPPFSAPTSNLPFCAPKLYLDLLATVNAEHRRHRIMWACQHAAPRMPEASTSRDSPSLAGSPCSPSPHEAPQCF